MRGRGWGLSLCSFQNGEPREMKKTLFVMFDFPPRVGGAQGFNWDMVRALPSDKVVIVAQKWGKWRDFDSRSGYKTYRLPWQWMEKMKVPLLPVVVPYLAMREKVGQIWFSKYSRTMYFTTLLTSNLLRLPFGITVFGEDVKWAAEEFGVRLPALALRLRDSTLKKASRVVANSRFSGSLLPSGVQYSVIYPCTKQDNRPVNTLTMPSLVHHDSRGITFLSVGSLTKKKGFDLVIKALADRLPGVRGFRYLIAGAGPEEDSLKKLVEELGLEKLVKILGDTSDDMKHFLYRHADVFVMPSRTEGFGIVFLEAAIHGCCSVGSRAGGIPEAVVDGKTGILVENENIKELRDALALLGRNGSLRRRMARAARTRCKKYFLWERFAKEWISVLNPDGTSG